MDQLPTWLENAITAAGVCTVYNADDWDRMTQRSAKSAETQADEDTAPPSLH